MASFRRFEGIDKNDSLAQQPQAVDYNAAAKIEALRNNIIGSYQSFVTPYGKKPILYGDWTASGRPGAHVLRCRNDLKLP